jgi:peptidoglycan/LPS O-acetylase OafA/YrhL
MSSTMNRPFSVYLDLVRFIAAVLVYLWHSNQTFLIASGLPASQYGHSAVVVFFVLSGFVIAFVTATKENTAADYMAGRVSRVFSVAVPAVVLTVLLDSIGRVFYPAIYSYPYDQFLARIVGSLLMANEVWLISITSFSNVPYWSICYEWWYYVTFGMVMFFPRRLGMWLALALALVIGPKLILLAPIWWMGVLLYRWSGLLNLPIAASWAMVGVSSLGIVLFHRLSMMGLAEGWLERLIGHDLAFSLAFSKRVFADYVLGMLVFVNFAGMRNVLAVNGCWLVAMAKPVRFFANFTFTLYLLHQPLFLFWAALVRGNPNAPWYWLSVTVLTMLSVGIVGTFTENRRHTLRAWMRPLFRRLEAGWGFTHPVVATTGLQPSDAAK